MSANYEDRMKDYVPVNERIEAFYTAFPNGSIQSEIVELTDKRVTVKAYAFRTVEDPKPGTGHSSVNIPGSTPYTKGSEIENAETSAWGRAIAALGFEVKRGISSKEEVANKQSGRGARPSRPMTPAAEAAAPVPAPTGPSLDQIKARLLRVADEHGIDTARYDELVREYVPANPDAESLKAALILLGTDIQRGKHDAPDAAGDATEAVPVAPGQVSAELMSDEDALAAGAALVGKS